MYCTTSYDSIVVFLHFAYNNVTETQYLDLYRLAKITMSNVIDGMKLRLMILG